MGEEMLDLLDHDRRQVVAVVDLVIIREGRIDRHGEQLLVAALVVLQQQHADRPHPDHAPGMNGQRAITSASSGSPSSPSVCGMKP